MPLKGDAGARKIITQHSDEVATVPFEKGKIEIDTEADYNALSWSFLPLILDLRPDSYCVPFILQPSDLRFTATSPIVSKL